MVDLGGEADPEHRVNLWNRTLHALTPFLPTPRMSAELFKSPRCSKRMLARTTAYSAVENG